MYSLRNQGLNSIGFRHWIPPASQFGSSFNCSLISIMKNLPCWHEQPLSLTKDEISDPMLVLSDFLYSYPLPDVREYIKTLLILACNDPDCNAAFSIILCEDIIRLIESCHVINQINYGRN